MRILDKDLKKGVKVQADDLDDLWVLSMVIEPGDAVHGSTLRKVKITDREGEVIRVSKVHVRLALTVEQVEFHEHSGALRVSGVITEGPEDVPRGSHHTFNVEAGTVITISKQMWLRFHLDRLEEATRTVSPILVCVLDREEAILALFEKRGPRILLRMRGDLPKKGEPSEQQTSFFEELAGLVQEHVARHGCGQIVIASPSFWREDLAQRLPPDLRSRAILSSCTSATESALQELARRPELKQALRQDRVSRETLLVDEVLVAIAARKPAAYGKAEVDRAAWAGAVKMLLVSTSYLSTAVKEQRYQEVDGLMRHVEIRKGEVHLIESSHDAGRSLDSLGGIAAILRYQL